MTRQDTSLLDRLLKGFGFYRLPDPDDSNLREHVAASIEGRLRNWPYVNTAAEVAVQAVHDYMRGAR